MGIIRSVMRGASRIISRDVQPNADRYDEVTNTIESHLRRTYGEHFATLWLFPNKEEFDNANKHGVYPRGRQSLPPGYQHLPSSKSGYPTNFQELVKSLMNNEGEGEVHGIYLGWSDIVHYRANFRMQVHQSDLLNPTVVDRLYPNDKAGPVVALGVANLSLHYDKKYIKTLMNQLRGHLIGSSLERMQFDREKLQWKWTECSFTGVEPCGQIHGRVVGAEAAAGGNIRIIHGGENLPLQNAQEAIAANTRENPQIGLAHHEVQVVEQNRRVIPNINNTWTDENGRFTLTIPAAYFNQPLLVLSPSRGGRRSGVHTEGWPHALITLRNDARIFRDAVVPKLPVDYRQPQVIIVPTPSEHGHNNSLQAPFGTNTPAFLDLRGNNPPHHEVSFAFKMKSPARNGGGALYHVFFATRDHANIHILTSAQLQGILRVTPGQVSFKRGTATPDVNPNYQDNFLVPYRLDHAVAIDVKASFDKLTLPGNNMIFIFVAVLDEQFQRNINLQSVDNMIFRHAAEMQNMTDALQRVGVLDFNYYPVLIANDNNPTAPAAPLQARPAP